MNRLMNNQIIAKKKRFFELKHETSQKRTSGLNQFPTSWKQDLRLKKP